MQINSNINFKGVILLSRKDEQYVRPEDNTFESPITMSNIQIRQYKDKQAEEADLNTLRDNNRNFVYMSKDDIPVNVLSRTGNLIQALDLVG